VYLLYRWKSFTAIFCRNDCITYSNIYYVTSTEVNKVELALQTVNCFGNSAWKFGSKVQHHGDSNAFLAVESFYCRTCIQRPDITVNAYMNGNLGRNFSESIERVDFSHFYRAMLCIRGTSHGPVSVRLSVCLSVTSQSSTKTAKRRITQTTPHDCPGTLVLWCQRSPRNSTGVTPIRGRRMQVGWVKIGDFWLITGYISKTVQDRHILPIKVE